jgi:hypothetical protein
MSGKKANSKAPNGAANTKAPLGGAASTPVHSGGKGKSVSHEESSDSEVNKELAELLDVKLEDVIEATQRIDTASVPTPSGGVVFSQLAQTVIPPLGASESTKNAKEAAFSFAAPSVEAAVVLKTKAGVSFKLPVLQDLVSKHAAEFIQELIRIAAQISAHSDGITMSTPSEKDVSLDEDQVKRIKGNPLEALDSILKQNLRMLLSGEALSSVRTICGKASVLHVTNADIMTVVADKAKHHSGRDTNPAKYLKDMKLATAEMPILQRPSEGCDTQAEEYALKFMNKIEALHSVHATLLNGSDINKAQHTKGVVGMLKPASLMYYVLHRIISEPGYSESLWKDVREVLNRIHVYCVQLDGFRVLNKDYLNSYTVSTHLPLWDIGNPSKLSHFKAFWPASPPEKQRLPAKEFKGDSGTTDKRKSGSGWRDNPKGKSPAPKGESKHPPKGDKEGKQEPSLPAPEVPVVGKIGKPASGELADGQEKDKSCIVCGELGHKGDHCTQPCACGIVPATSIAVTGKRHNPWECPTMKGKRGVNKRKRESA